MARQVEIPHRPANDLRRDSRDDNEWVDNLDERVFNKLDSTSAVISYPQRLINHITRTSMHRLELLEVIGDMSSHEQFDDTMTSPYDTE